MRCQKFRDLIHDYLDMQLSVQEMTAIQSHLDRCPGCLKLYEEFLTIRKTLASRITMPEACSQHIWKEVQHSRQRNLRMVAAQWWDALYTLWRDTDRKYIWSKLSATPVTFLFFALIFGHFAPGEIQPSNFYVFSLEDWPESNRDVLTVQSVEVEQNRSQIRNLVEAAWKLPYEDSLSLIAEITPEGNARIGDILVHPKSNDLLQAVNLTLQNARFDRSPRVPRQYLIYSFQKIDVWYDARTGL